MSSDMLDNNHRKLQRVDTPAMNRKLKSALVLSGLMLVTLLLLRYHTTRYMSVLSKMGGGRLHTSHQTVNQLTRDSCEEKKETRTTISPQCPPSYIMDKTEDYVKFLQLPQSSPFTNSSNQNLTSKIVILTPVSNSADRLAHYFQLLCTLTYPHELISIAFGEDTSTDKTYSIAQRHAEKLKGHFRNVSVFRSAEDLQQRPVYTRHDPGFQRVRRRHMALARNQLLARGITDEDWVLWIDSDVKYVPPDLIQHLLSAKKDIVAPSCMYTSDSGVPLVYDRNTWRETDSSKTFLSKVDRDFLMLEGYDQSRRIYLPALHNEGDVVKIDGVGGCVLLVRADCHRKGLIFPPFIFDNHIETEGLGKMAARMGFELYGLPHLWALHA